LLFVEGDSCVKKEESAAAELNRRGCVQEGSEAEQSNEMQQNNDESGKQLLNIISL
jgi:hypothetical protein